MITNNDGSPYKLRTPNPIMNGQNVWKDGIGHNLDQFEEVSYIPRSWKFKEIKIDEKKEEEITNEQPEVISELSPPARLIFDLDESRTKCWVLPTEFQITKDPVYGQESKRLIWGKKFSMEIKFDKVGDVFSVFWTNAIKSINKGSIIYVELRYWKVDSLSPGEDNGILINCSITDQTYSFA